MLDPAEDESLKNWISSKEKYPSAVGQGHGRRVWKMRGSFLTRETKRCPQLSNHRLWRAQNQPFLRCAQEKTMGSERKVLQVKCPIDVKKQCFTMRAVDLGLRKCVEFPSLQILSGLSNKDPEQPSFKFRLT